MRLSIISPSLTLPPIIAQAPPRVHMHFLEFFAANIRKPHMRRAYAKAARDFLTWCFDHGVRRLDEIVDAQTGSDDHRRSVMSGVRLRF